MSLIKGADLEKILSDVGDKADKIIIDAATIDASFEVKSKQDWDDFIVIEFVDRD